MSLVEGAPEELRAQLEQLETEIRRLSDRAAITDLFSQFSGAMDARDWGLLAGSFAEDAVLDRTYETWEGTHAEKWVGRDEIIRQMSQGISQHFVSHHMITNHRSMIDGDRARAVAYLHSVHLPDPARPEEHDDHGAWYLCELARVKGSWKFTRLKHIAVWRAENMRAEGPITREEVAEMSSHLDG